MRTLMAIALGFALLFATSPTLAEVRNKHAVAVIIGNKDYKHERVPDVAYAHRDAEAMKRYVIDVLGYREANIIDLRDATKAQIEAAFGNERSHKGKLWSYLHPRGGSDVFVYFSGHGVPGQKDKRGYLLPVNADPDLAEINGYAVDLLYRNLAKLKARSVTVLLEACFSGDSPRGMLIRAASPVYLKANISAPKNMIVLTAASGMQLASWDEKRGHGLFTDSFLSGIYGAADTNGDGIVTLAEIKEHLFDTMTIAARRTFNREQVATVIGAEDTVLAELPGGQTLDRPLLREPIHMKSSATTTTVAISPQTSKERLSPISKIYYTKRNTNIRAGPSVNSAKVNTLPKGTGVYAFAATANGKWMKVSRNGNVLGYIYGALLESADAVEKTLERTNKKYWEDLERLSKAERRLQDEFRRLKEENSQLVGELQNLDTLAAAKRSARAIGSRPAVARHGVPGKSLRDCDQCPEMVVVPGGSFIMGSPTNELGRSDAEGPQRQVTIAHAFAVGRYEVTFEEWDACIADGGCGGFRSQDWGIGRGRRPVFQVSWNDAHMFVAWLRKKTGKAYRLLTEAEWEYSARAGTTTRFSWGGQAPACINGAVNGAKFDDGNSCSANGTSPVGSFSPNGFGLYDMHGNVWEWVEDCAKVSYAGMRRDGAAVGDRDGTCSRVKRGGSWGSEATRLRSASRSWVSREDRHTGNGFRVARSLQ